MSHHAHNAGNSQMVGSYMTGTVVFASPPWVWPHRASTAHTGFLQTFVLLRHVHPCQPNIGLKVTYSRRQDVLSHDQINGTSEIIINCKFHVIKTNVKHGNKHAKQSQFHCLYCYTVITGCFC